ncbi:MAG: transglycosylase domain-containing protein [Odoribacter sp.]
MIIVAGVGLLVYSVYVGLWGKLPTYDELKNIRNDEASILYSEDGVLIGKYYVENRTNVNFTHISPHAIKALIATEDVRFYQHEGVDKISMLRVFFKTFLLGRRSAGGGSTISQQLAKNLYPREEQQVTFIPIVKLKEMFTARRLENTYSKDEVLTLYLNTVSFGENTFGIESAAQKYFSASASELTIPQAATLIGMLKGPSYYNPRLHPDRALQRRNTVISQMVKYDFLPEEKGEKLKQQALDLQYTPINHYSGLAPYLREKIRQDALHIIGKYNEEYNTNYNLYRDGLIITTTLDAEMQQYAEDAVAHHMQQLQQAYYSHLGKKEPWDSNRNYLQNAIHNSRAYKILKNQGLNERSGNPEKNARKKGYAYL